MYGCIMMSIILFLFYIISYEYNFRFNLRLITNILIFITIKYSLL